MGVVGGGGDERQDPVAFLLAHLPAADRLLHEVGGVAFALVGRLLRLVDQHRLDAGHGLHVGDARAHHAGAQHRHLLRVGLSHARGAADSLVQLLHRQEQRADHALGLGRHQRLDEVAALDPQRRVHRHLQALVDALHDVDLGRIVAVALLAQHGVAHDEQLRAARAVGAAAGDLEALLVPPRDGIAGLHPSLGRRDFLTRSDHLVDDAGGLGLLRTHRLAFEQVGGRGHDPDQARQPLGAAAAGEQAHLGLGQAELRLRVVADDPVVAGERDFQPAAQRQAVDRRRHGLAAGLELAQLQVQARGAVERRLQLLLRRAARPVARSHLAKVRPGAEAGGLARGDDRALDGVVGPDALDHLRQLLGHLGGDGVHRTAGHVERDQRDAVRVDVDLERFHGCLRVSGAAVRRARLAGAGRTSPSAV